MDGEVLSSAGAKVGMIAYLSPEQARGKLLDTRTDLFSLGAVLYEMVTGMLPFRGETPAMVFDAILNRTPVSASRLNPQVPAKLQDILAKLLEKKRELRYQGAAEVRADLQRLKRAMFPETHSVEMKPPIVRPAAHRAGAAVQLGKYLSAAALLAAVAAGIVFLYMRREHGERCDPVNVLRQYHRRPGMGRDAEEGGCGRLGAISLSECFP